MAPSHPHMAGAHLPSRRRVSRGTPPRECDLVARPVGGADPLVNALPLRRPRRAGEVAHVTT
eukprot:2360519-Prymnesium_polylepis.1